MQYVGRQASPTQPLRSIPLYRTVASVFGATAAELADAELRQAEQALKGETALYATARAALGTANRRPVMWRDGPIGCRAYHQREAMKAINARRKLLRAAQRRMLAAEAAHAALTPADAYATPYLAQLAAERATTQQLAA